MLPFTPRGKNNLAAWMVARSDGENYGKMLVFQFPKQKVVFGPSQIVARINQDQEISPQITLWNQQGSEVIQGTLLVIPIEEALLYIRPLYLRASGGRIPELKRVVVAYQNQIVMEETLDQALNRLFGRAVRPVGPGRPDAGSRRGEVRSVTGGGGHRNRRAGRAGAEPLLPGVARPAGRRLGALRPGDRATWRGAGRDAGQRRQPGLTRSAAANAASSGGACETDADGWRLCRGGPR